MTDTRYARWGDQASFGTAVTPDEYLLLVSESIVMLHDAIKNTRPERVASTSRSLSGARRVAGSIDIYQNYDQLRSLLSKVVSDAVVTDVDTDVDQAEFVPDPHFVAVPRTLDISRDEAIHRYIGMTATSMRLSIGLGDRHFGVSLSMIGKDEDTPQALETVTSSWFKRPAEIGGTPATTPFEIIISDGSTNWTACLDSIDMQFTWNRVLRMPARSATPTGIIGGSVIGASVSARTMYEAETEFLLEAYRNRTPVSIKLTMQGEEIESTGYYESLEVFFTYCILMSAPPTISTSGSGNIPFSLKFMPLLDTSTASGPFRFRMNFSAPEEELPPE